MAKSLGSKFPTSSVANHRGNALVGVMAAGVISGIIAVSTYRMLASQMRNQRLIGANAERSILRSQIQGVLSDNKLCGSAFKDAAGNKAKFTPDTSLPLNATTIQKQLYKSQNSLSKIMVSKMIISQDGADSGGMVVLSHTLTELDKTLRTPVTLNGIPGLRIVAQLKIELEKSISATSRIGAKPMEFPLFLVINDSLGVGKNEVMECGSMAPMDLQGPPGVQGDPGPPGPAVIQLVAAAANNITITPRSTNSQLVVEVHFDGSTPIDNDTYRGGVQASFAINEIIGPVVTSAPTGLGRGLASFNRGGTTSSVELIKRRLYNNAALIGHGMQLPTVLRVILDNKSVTPRKFTVATYGGTMSGWMFTVTEIPK